ncbi:glycoside hydrolase family 43 protein [Microbacterium telephonicum]|uniref:Glycosyl hydrolase family 43 n=1 Tax=Microbacterium telephonicum TaxID=1714841 RepID=A0A498CDU9_9MICO|nr:glycoside hydrolase family 43 protein [Microbacterium telephonicum]RLK52656.1 glycosyl hydrolase family 43 [Microbacterium telephonicum]
MTDVRPIIPGFYPDPSICRVGDVYYVVNSSFEYLPGLPIHASTDLVTWRFVGNALTRPSQIPEHRGNPSGSVYAPTIRHHDGRFWIVWTDTNQHGAGVGQLLVHAEDAAGPWSDPVEIPGTVGIDPDLSWDEDGVCHLTWAPHAEHLHPLGTVPIDPETGTLLAEPRLLWRGTGGAHPEGPHLYRIDGWWYLLAAEGGTERGHSVTIARARTLDGPFEPAPTNPILTHRGIQHPVQNAGHGDLVQLVNGSWAMVHLGVRPRGATPGFHLNGRETFLVGVDWVDGWPVVDEGRFTATPVDASFHDDFTDAALAGRWLGVGMFPETFTEPTGDGGGVVVRAGRGPGIPLLCVRAVDEEWTVDARVDAAGGVAALEVRIDEAHSYALVHDGRTVSAVLTIGPAVSTLATVESGPEAVLRLRARLPEPTSRWGEPQPDIVDLVVVSAEGAETVLGSADGRYLSTEVAGLFTGRVVGVRAVSGDVVLRSFSYTAGPRDAGDGRAADHGAAG